MEKKMEHEKETGAKRSYLWLAGNEGMEKTMETNQMGCMGPTDEGME